ncbi:MAG: hypothetical protein LBU39_04990 [Desulfobulbaceae bacterium]|jgi:GGDEF domain-containing protein|nr:hypothetical protein [Desulfobulbaceae bacterium]
MNMFSSLRPLVVLSARANDLPLKEDDCFASWDEFLQSGSEARGFLVEDFTAESLAALIYAIRQSRWWALPIIGSKDAPPDDFFLLDALLASDEARAFSTDMAVRHEEMPGGGESMGLDEKILYFLYVRGPRATLKPFLDRDSFRLYRYLVAEYLAGEGEDAAQTIDRLYQHGLLERVDLLDRTQHCPACGSAHLHVLMVCPRCDSIDIHRDGMEGFTCASCHHSFGQGIAHLRCLDCGQDSAAEQVTHRDISTLALSRRGRTAVRAGEIRESFAALDNERYVDPTFFRRMLDWMLSLHARHQDFHFSLLYMNFVNAETILARVGERRLYLLLNEFANSLLDLLRTSDFTTRTQEQNLWLLMPLSAAEGVSARLMALFERLQTAHKIEERFEIDIRSLDVTEGAALDLPAASQEADADALMTSLSSLSRPENREWRG